MLTDLFLGISYGTTLGRTVAAMFPDRIDKMVLDGVQNVHEYYHALAYVANSCFPSTSFNALTIVLTYPS